MRPIKTLEEVRSAPPRQPLPICAISVQCSTLSLKSSQPIDAHGRLCEREGISATKGSG